MSEDNNDIFPEPSSGAGKSTQVSPALHNGTGPMDAAQARVVSDALENQPNVEDNESLINQYVEVQTESYSGFAIKDDEVLCSTCKHCWSVRKYAQVMNVDVDGKPFMAREGYCMATPHSLFSLGDRFVLECNLYEKGGKPRITLEDIKD